MPWMVRNSGIKLLVLLYGCTLHAAPGQVPTVGSVSRSQEGAMSTAPLRRSAMDGTPQTHPDDGGSGFTPTMIFPSPGHALAQRQCGRCREWFDGDATLHPTALPTWWLCPPCHVALLGAR